MPSTKTYTLTVPVYAAIDGTSTKVTQEDWNAVKNVFTVSTAKGGSEKYEVIHNLATAANAPYQIYPDTEIKDAKGNSFFPLGQWGFAVSSRNYSNYNYPMLMDELLWNTYTVSSISVDWTPSCGSFQNGSLEVVFVPNAAAMPNIPFSNMGENAALFQAINKGTKTFRLDGVGIPNKNMRSVQEKFDQTADYGIIYLRTYGYTWQAAAGATVGDIVEVGSMKIYITATLQSYQPDAHAQLIGPWISAGYPITANGGSTTTSNVQLATSTNMLDVSNATEVSKEAIKRGRAKMPRWRLVGTAAEKTVKSLGGSAGVHRAKKVASAAANGEASFPVLAQSTFDGAISGKTILDSAAEGAGLNDAFAVVNPRVGVNEFVTDADTVFIDAQPVVTPAVGAGEDGERVLLNYYPNKAAVNGTALAQGDIEVAYNADGTNIGMKVGATVKSLVCFAIGAGPVSESLPENQVAAGWEPGVGTVGDVSVPVESPSGEDKMRFFATVAALAGAIDKALPGTGAVGSFKMSASNTKMASPAQAVVGTIGGTTAAGEDAAVSVQSTQLTVPDNATYRSKIGAVEAGSVDYNTLKAFFGALPAASKYCLQSFESDKLTDEMARLTVTGQSNTLYTAFVSTYGAPLPSLSAMPYDVTAAELSCLVASRVDPGENVSGFLNTAIPITLIQDGKHSTATSGNMYIQRTENGTDFNGAFNVDRITQRGSQVRITNANLGAFATAQLVSECPLNFTVAWPDKLVDPESGELTALAAGEKVYISLVKGSAVTFAHTITETVGSYRMTIWPQLCKGTDKVAETEALHKYGLTTDNENKTVVKAIVQEGALAETEYYQEDGERRFTVQSAAPVDATAAPRGGIRMVRQ
jgi:hypothetical protein